MTGLGQVSFLGLLGHIKLLCGLNPFIERSETLEKVGAERPGVLVKVKFKPSKLSSSQDLVVGVVKFQIRNINLFGKR